MQWKQLEKQLHEESKQATPLPFSIKRKAESLSGIDLTKLSIVYSNKLKDLPASAALYQHCIFQKNHDEFTTLHEIGHYVFQHHGFTKSQSSPPLLSCSEEQEADEFAKQSYHAKALNTSHLNKIPDQAQDTILFRLYVGNLDQKTIEKESLTLTKATGEKHPTELDEDYHEYKLKDFNELFARYEIYKKETYSKDKKHICYNTYLRLCNHPKKNKDLDKEYEASYYFRDELELFRYFDIKLDHAFTATASVSKPILPKINMINVGAGDSILIRTPETYILVDLGRQFQKVNDFLSLVKAKFSEDEQLDITSSQLQVLITHGDNDHTGGSIRPKKIAEYLKRGHVICGTAKYQDYKLKEPSVVEKLQEALTSGGYQILEGKSPLTEEQTYKNKIPDGKNGDSLPFIRIDKHEIQIFTGDIRMGDTEGEQAASSSTPSRKTSDREGLLDRIKKHEKELNTVKTQCQSDHIPLPVVLLKVPHHGSIENLSREFFTYMKPFCSRFILMISSKNKHSHPSIMEFIREVEEDRKKKKKLYPQGQRLRFREEEISSSMDIELDDTDPISSTAALPLVGLSSSESISTTDDDIVIDLYYTYNMLDEIGSIVHKQSSDYQLSSTYTKTWTLPKDIEETGSRMDRFLKNATAANLHSKIEKELESSKTLQRSRKLHKLRMQHD